MFAAIYVVQGIGLAYFQSFQKPYLNSLGVSAGNIGLLTFILYLPFIIKIFIGMLSDKVNLFGYGHRKPYIVLGLILAAVSFSGAALALPDSNYGLYTLLITLGSLGVTIFDSIADGLAIDITPSQEIGKVQGVMVGGRASAVVLLSLIFGYLIQRTGYRPIFPIIGLSMLIPLIWVLRVKEPPRTNSDRAFQWSAFRSLGQPRFLIFALYAVVYSLGSFGTEGLVTYFMSKGFHASEIAIGQYGALRGAGAIVGAIGGGYLIDRMGRRKGAFAAVVMISLGATAIGLAPSLNVILGLGLLWGMAWAFQETIFFSLAMEIADGRIAASMFAIMMSISNLGSALADSSAAALSDTLGFTIVFLLLAGINLVTLPVLEQLFKVAPEIAQLKAQSLKMEPLNETSG